jgi:hypothetical protein
LPLALTYVNALLQEIDCDLKELDRQTVLKVDQLGMTAKKLGQGTIR